MVFWAVDFVINQMASLCNCPAEMVIQSRSGRDAGLPGV